MFLEIFGFIHKKLLSYKMALIQKGAQEKHKAQVPQLEQEELTKGDLEFILVKLRSSTYRGDEFEAYYNIVSKISYHLNNM